ncbi:MAG: GrpB family protein [Candidatus Sericytochromatia bacterium]|nr:GrpB family protein [Candidatus Sericytochromatia bacterium]
MNLSPLNPVKIINYQPSWSNEFLQIGQRLRQGLGQMALRIDHIGSTSVPGLAAKDVIDVQITVSALSEELTEKMCQLGYVLPDGIWRDHAPPGQKGPVSDWDKLLFRPPPGQRSTNTHVRVEGRPNQRYPLVFRDYLRAHPLMAAAYAELKLRLAMHLVDGKMYPEVKDPAVDLIYFSAQDWAIRNNWEPSPSDI